MIDEVDSVVVSGNLRIVEAWRYPVKSMGGEKLSEAEVGPNGVKLDRAWAVRDEKLGVIRGARYLPKLLLCTARYLPGTNAGLVPHVEITLPDGEVVRSDEAQTNRRLSDAVGRELRLEPIHSVGPVDRGGDEPLTTGDPELEHRMLLGLSDDQPLPDYSELANDYTIPLGAFLDAFPIHFLTTSSLRYLQRLLPDANLDARRFRPNFLIDDNGLGDGLLEQCWIGQNLDAGTAEFHVAGGCVRCIMVSAQQPDGIVRDNAIVRAIARGLNSRLGVYAVVTQPGIIKTGDLVCPAAPNIRD